jgi:Holliday junction resolvasome RuvABC endonuclease subunit
VKASTVGRVIVGYDPGITTPGIAAVLRESGGGFKIVEHKVVRTSTAGDDVTRYFAIFDELGRIIRATNALDVFGEEQRTIRAGKEERAEESNANNSKTLITVGVAIGAARAYGANYTEVRTRTVRTKVMGKGRGSASTKEVQKFVEAITGTWLAKDSAAAALNAIYGHLSGSPLR